MREKEASRRMPSLTPLSSPSIASVPHSNMIDLGMQGTCDER